MQVSGLAVLVMLLAGADPPLPPLSTALTGTVVNYDVRPGDSFQGIAARFGVDVATILRENGSVRAFPVAVGRRDWPTPIGQFRVVRKEEHPESAEQHLSRRDPWLSPRPSRTYAGAF